MTLSELLLNTTPHPILSMLVAVVLLVLVLFLARTFFYQAVRAFTRMIRGTARMAAISVLEAEKRLSERNRNVLIAKSLENAERVVERDSAQLHSAVTKYIRNYAVLHQRMSAAVGRLEEDHRRTMDVPPDLPNWQPILEAVARIESSRDVPVDALLGGIDRTLREQHRAALATYVQSIKKRHGILGRLVPLCSRLNQMMQTVDRSVKSLENRAERLDRSMEVYAEIRSQNEDTLQRISMSSLTQLFTSGLVLLIAAGGALINFHLMVLPMSEVFGSGSYIGPFKISQVAALGITAIELSLGIFLVESLQITRMIPIIGYLDDRMRVRLGWIALIFLLIFAGLEAALGLLRVQMVADIEQLQQMLSGVEPADAFSSRIPAIGQTILGFVLPFWIACGAVPLAAFVLAARATAGICACLALRLLAFGLRFFGNAVVHLGQVVVAVYDLLIFPVLLLDNAFQETGDSGPKRPNGSLLKLALHRIRRTKNSEHWTENSQ